tara:strand:- start:72 stop:266 length:195 start_codon:yes stop_codon:yes gene_type:complete
MPKNPSNGNPAFILMGVAGLVIGAFGLGEANGDKRMEIMGWIMLAIGILVTLVGLNMRFKIIKV